MSDMNGNCFGPMGGTNNNLMPLLMLMMFSNQGGDNCNMMGIDNNMLYLLIFLMLFG